jgi:hypothetical protein
MLRQRVVESALIFSTGSSSQSINTGGHRVQAKILIFSAGGRIQALLLVPSVLESPPIFSCTRKSLEME